MSEPNKQDEALVAIQQYHADKDLRWRMDVLMRDFFACVGCGERDRKLLESHHIKPRAQFPELAHNLDNGETDCLWRHALQHKNNPVVMNMILLRLVHILTERLYKPLSVCQKALFQNL